MHSVQPFELLGLTISSSLVEVRKRYYELALLCHPDKGGNVSDMIMLHNAYKWIEQQLVAMAGKEHHVYEDAQKAFDEFVEQRKENEVLPSMTDIALASAGLTKDDIYHWYLTNAPSEIRDDKITYGWFEQIVSRDIYLYSFKNVADQSFTYVCQNVLDAIRASKDTLQHASIPGGYGDMMLDSQSDETTVPYIGKQELILYKEQTPVLQKEYGSFAYGVPNTLDTYTTMTASGLHANDYKEAFSEPCIPLDENSKHLCPSYIEPFLSVEDQLEEAQLQRKMMDLTLQKEHKEHIRMQFI